MKKLLILIAVILCCSIISLGQGVPITNQISISNASTEYHVKGLLTGDVGVRIPTLDTLNHPATTFAGSIIRQIDGFAYMSNGVFWERIGSTSGGNLLAELPLYIDINSQGQQVLKILHPDGIFSPGYVSWSGVGLIFDVTSSIYYLNYQQYISPSSQITLNPADSFFSRIDKIGVDTFSSVIQKPGSAASSPIAPQLNPRSQLPLTDIFLLANDTVPSGINLETIFDGIIDNPAQWDTSISGAVSVNFSNTDNPYHLAQAAYISTYTDSTQLIFISPDLKSAAANSLLKMFIYINGAFSNNNISFQLFNNSAAASLPLMLNAGYGFDPLDSNAYQNVTIPMNDFTWLLRDYNQLVITMYGEDISGAKGFYIDWIQLQTGINNVPVNLNNKVDSVFMVGTKEYYGINGIFHYIVDIGDTIFTELPIFVRLDSNYNPVRRIITLLHANGLYSGGIVTVDSCMTIDITPPVFYINYKQYTGSQTLGVTITAADPSLPRIDRVVIDTNLVVSVIAGTPSATPIAPPFNPFSQVELAQIPVGAGITCLGSIEPIFDGIVDDPAQWDTATAGTLSVNFSNTDNPYHLAQAAYTVTYEDSSQLIFTKPSGTDTVKATSILKGFIYIIGGLTNQISGQWFNGTTAVSSQLLLNPYFNVNDSNQYQIFAPPLSAWSWPGGNVFNKLILTFGGEDVSGSKGIYLDWLQLQTGINNVSTSLQLTTVGTSGASTLVNNVLNIPIYSGGGGSGGGSDLANFYLKDSTLSSNRIADLNGKTLTFRQSGNAWLFLDPTTFDFKIGPSDATATATSFMQAKANLIGGEIYFVLNTTDGVNNVTVNGDALANSLYYTAATHIFNGKIVNAIDSINTQYNIATWDGDTLKRAALPNVTASNGLTESADNIILGGTLNQATTIAKANNAFTMNGKGNITLEEIDIDGANATANITLQSSTGGNLPFIQMNAFDLDNTNLSTFSLSSTGMGIDISSVSSGGTSIFFQPSNNSVALSDPSGSTTSFFQKLSGGDTTTTITTQNGVTGKTTSITMPDSALIVVSVTPGNVVNTSFYLQRQLSTGSVGDGLGQALSFRLPTTTGIDNANKIISKWTTAADATRTSEISITGVNSAVTQTLLTLSGNGEVIINSGALRLKGYTVATLPAGVQGDFAFVTDALAPAYHVTVVGGGAVIVPVFFNGTNWIVN